MALKYVVRIEFIVYSSKPMKGGGLDSSRSGHPGCSSTCRSLQELAWTSGLQGLQYTGQVLANPPSGNVRFEC
jgi:hypothetical protein